VNDLTVLIPNSRSLEMKSHAKREVLMMAAIIVYHGWKQTRSIITG